MEWRLIASLVRPSAPPDLHQQADERFEFARLAAAAGRLRQRAARGDSTRQRISSAASCGAPGAHRHHGQARGGLRLEDLVCDGQTAEGALESRECEAFIDAITENVEEETESRVHWNNVADAEERAQKVLAHEAPEDWRSQKQFVNEINDFRCNDVVAVVVKWVNKGKNGFNRKKIDKIWAQNKCVVSDEDIQNGAQPADNVRAVGDVAVRDTDDEEVGQRGLETRVARVQKRLDAREDAAERGALERGRGADGRRLEDARDELQRGRKTTAAGRGADARRDAWQQNRIDRGVEWRSAVQRRERRENCGGRRAGGERDNVANEGNEERRIGKWILLENLES